VALFMATAACSKSASVVATGGIVGSGGVGGSLATDPAGGAGAGGLAAGGAISAGGTGAGGAPPLSDTGGSAGIASGGKGGGPASGGAAGQGEDPCGDTVVCIVGSMRCPSDTQGEICALSANGCPFWTAIPAQPICCPGIGCIDFCEGLDDLACGGKEGTSCPTVGGTLAVDCARVPPGAFHVARRYVCPQGQTCDAKGVVPLGSACGCPPVGDDFGTGCLTLQETVPLPCHSSRRCEAVGACQIWRFVEGDP
jgi:hypothetical protein